MIRVRKPLTALGVSALCLATVIACSSSGGTKSDKSGDAVPNKKTDNAVNQIAATPLSQVKDGGTMTFALSQAIPNFNYYELDGTLLDNLNMFSSYLPRPFNFSAAGLPATNTDYFTSIAKTSDSPETIEYKINPKAKWSDGKAITWQDFKSLWLANSGKNSTYKLSGSTGWDQIASVTKGSDDRDVVVKFGKTFTDWQSLFDPLLPSSVTSTPAAFNTSWVDHPLVTAGPFKWGSQNKTAKTYTVVRDPNWWGQKAKLDSITFAVYNDPGTAVQALGTGSLDYDDITFGDEVSNVNAAGKYSGISIRKAGSNIYRQFTINTKSTLLSDESVRQAVVLGVDRQAITRALIGPLGGSPTPLQNHFFMKNQAPYEDTCGDYCAYNPTKAVQLLTSDGWTKSGTYFAKGGKTLSIAITIPSQTPNALLEAQIAQATLKKAGIELTIKSVPGDDFFPKYVNIGKFDLTTFTWIGTQFPIGGALNIFKYDTKQIGQNYGAGGNAQINSLLLNSYTAASADKENDLANTASKEMWPNASWLPLYQKPQAVAVKSGLVNIGANGFANIQFAKVGYKA